MTWQQIGDVAQTLYERLFRCEHCKTRIVWTEFANDGSKYQRPQLRNYCDDCGRLVGSALKHSLATDVTPMLSREEATRPERLWREYSEQREAEREHQAERWRADYEAYLLSPEWDDKRALVLKRARGICEGCGEVPATEVHHLTYTHVGNELLWQLVAVCRQLPRPRSRYRGRQHCGGGTWQSSSWVISAQRTRACGPVFRNCNSLSESLEKTGDATNDRTDVLRQV